MAFVGNVPHCGYLYPGTKTSSKSPIGFVKTSQTGNFEFMYFKDYNAYIDLNGKLDFKFLSFEDEFLSGGRKVETEFRFNASFLRVPKEFKYVIVAADPTRTKYIDGKERSIYKKITFLENSTIYSGMVLLNIHSEKENTPCRDAYIPHNQHYLTSKKGKKENDIDLDINELNTFKEDNFYPYPIPGFAATRNPRAGCEQLAYLGKDKPILFQFFQTKAGNNVSYMILSIGTDNCIAYLEANNAPGDYYTPHKDDEKILNDIDYYIDTIKTPINKDGYKMGIQNLHPRIHGVYRFEDSFGVSFLLSNCNDNNTPNLPKNGWNLSYWDVKNYYANE